MQIIIVSYIIKLFNILLVMSAGFGTIVYLCRGTFKIKQLLTDNPLGASSTQNSVTVDRHNSMGGGVAESQQHRALSTSLACRRKVSHIAAHDGCLSCVPAAGACLYPFRGRFQRKLD